MSDDDTFDPLEPLTELELATLEAVEATRLGQDVYTQPSQIQRLVAEVRRLRELVDIPDEIYRSEIHGSVRWIWDGGFEWDIGGSRKRSGETETHKAALEAMARAAAELFPDSPFAKWYAKN